MAINAFEEPCNKIDRNFSSNSHMLKLCITADDNLSINDSKIAKVNSKCSKSPYLTGDNVHLVSRVTEKKLYHKKATNMVSSFPLAVNIYKANSDEFKSLKKPIRKTKKSVLTLPNVPASLPKTCTVSDMNDSEYLKSNNENKNTKTKKKFQSQNKKSNLRSKGYEFYDRDARFCSQMNIDLDCSSTDVIKQYTGDGKRISNKVYPRSKPNEFSAHDVWAVLQNINRFQFRPSPPMSDDSIQTPKKKKIRNRRRINRKDTRVVETCRTEEFAYSFEVDRKSGQSISLSSSFDRITVIDKDENFNEICGQFGNTVVKTENFNIMNGNRNASNKKQLKKRPVSLKECTNQLPNSYTKTNNVSANNKALVKLNENNCCRGGQPLDNVRNGSDSFLHLDSKDIVQGNMSEFNDPIKTNHPTPKQKKQKCETFSLISTNADKGLTDNNAKTRKDVSENVVNVPSNESAQHVKGITKVILRNGLDINGPKRIPIQRRSPMLGTLSPIHNVLPKLTQADIKRRLANIKFPVIILGRDETTSVEIPNWDAPQFYGMDQHIWPFMQSWNSNSVNAIRNAETTPKYLEANTTKSKIPIKEHNINIRKSPHKNKTGIVEIQAECSINKCLVGNEVTKCKKKPKHLLRPTEICKTMPQQLKKSVPFQQLKDKMLKILYKNVSVTSVDDHNVKGISCAGNYAAESPKETLRLDASTETNIKYDLISQTAQPKKPPITSIHPWAKGKWASDFVESVMKKIRNGVYYCHESEYFHSPIKDHKEVSIQTILTGKNLHMLDMPEEGKMVEDGKSVASKPNHYNHALPMFDESPPVLEIKTLNMKEISIKHCATNVIIQFDVALHPRADYSKRTLTYSFVPLSTTDSDTKIFKSETTIFNGMLPAEICTIFPKILKSITESNRLNELSTPTEYHNDSNLYTISELPRTESSVSSSIKYSMPRVINFSPKIYKLISGVYQEGRIHKCNKKSSTSHRFYVKNNIKIDVLQPLAVPKVFPYEVKACRFIMPPCSQKLSKESFKIHQTCVTSNEISTIKPTCTALQLYKPQIRAKVQSIFRINTTDSSYLDNLLQQLSNENLSIRFKMCVPLNVTLNTRNINVINLEFNKKNNSTELYNVSVDSLYKNHLRLDTIENVASAESKIQAIEYKGYQEKNTKKDSPSVLSHIKARKKSYVRLYKKCKSTSNISGERCSTHLSKVTNIDEFLQALGTGKMLSNVIDGHIGRKILSAITEVRNWISEMSSRQAMLILLLSNKKETQNLVRFRPIILQGIAVNRITRSSELDMEIEVIERENFNRFTQYEGISNLPEIVETRDNLMEELIWIAKTTASDYQKPFNECSEKLLKSLLEKRKKLNPSYLRVMARYVGLGLLRASK